MDIGKLDVVKLSNEGYKCVIRNPKTSDYTDIEIIIKGVYADEFRNESEKADTVELTSKLLAKYTIDWKGVEENGKDVKFSIKEAERIYLNFPIIRGQVLTAAMNVRNFIKD